MHLKKKKKSFATADLFDRESGTVNKRFSEKNSTSPTVTLTHTQLPN